MGAAPPEPPPADVVPADLPLGRYRHFEGQEYEALVVARHHETKEVIVVYRALYGDRFSWARPLADFVARLPVPGGGSVARFLFVGTAGDEFPDDDPQVGDEHEGDASA